MDWTAPFIVYRIVENGKLEEVFHAEDMKKAKYWLTYIAEPGDVLTRTPAHPKNEDSAPKYWQHKAQSGTTSTDQEEWKKLTEKSKCEPQFPEEQVHESSPT